MEGVPSEEYTTLRMVASVARELLARYPFDTPEQMKETWGMLALYLANVPDYDHEPTGGVDG